MAARELVGGSHGQPPRQGGARAGIPEPGGATALPLGRAVGAAYKLAGGHSIAAEAVNGPRGTGTDASIGGEFQAIKNLHLRAGYTTKGAVPGGSGFDAARGMTLGLGFRNEKWSLDYAVIASGELGRSHRFSVGARW